jgi:hypothetical protein
MGASGYIVSFAGRRASECYQRMTDGDRVAASALYLQILDEEAAGCRDSALESCEASGGDEGL